MRKGLYWFRNNLRLDDNPSLNYACRSFDELYFIFILDSKFLENTKWGFPHIGKSRLGFLMETVSEMEQKFHNKGVQLIFKIGKPETLIPELCNQLNITEIICSDEPAYWEKQSLKSLSRKFKVHTEKDSFLIEYPPLSKGLFPKGFSGFRKKVEKDISIRPPLDEPSQIPGSKHKIACDPLPSFEDRPKIGAFTFSGGERSAKARLHFYLHQTKKVSTYKQTRNGLLGEDYSSKFSPFLATGALSPVRIYHELKQYEIQNSSNESTYWLFFELLWRDYFRFGAEIYGNRLFTETGVAQIPQKNKYKKSICQKWYRGETGNDFIDANMKELNSTGYMSNRGRQNVASFLIHNLKQPWQFGAAYFESQLLDYDPGSNWGNWQYIAGIYSDAKEKVFDIEWQAKQYDPNGAYRTFWLKKD